MVSGTELANIGRDELRFDINVIYRLYQVFPAANNPCQCSLASFKLIKCLRRHLLGRVSNGR